MRLLSGVSSREHTPLSPRLLLQGQESRAEAAHSCVEATGDLLLWESCSANLSKAGVDRGEAQHLEDFRTFHKPQRKAPAPSA